MSKPAIQRRKFLQATGAGVAAAALSGASEGADGDPGPNFLVIMSDEHNTSVTGCYGNRIVRTPNLDRLAAEGVTFDNAYTNSPLCVPARMAFTAGKYVSRTGAWSNSSWLPSDDYPSLPRLLNTSGYESLLCGKQHYDATRRYGFTEIARIGNRSYKTGKGARRRADDESVKTGSRDQRFKAFHPGDDSGVLKHDRQVTKATVEFFRMRKRGQKPFLLFAGYVAPHFPLIVPERYWERYKGRVPMPVLPKGHVESQPLNYHHLRRGFGVVETDPAIVRKGRELYYGLTEWLDDEVGKVLEALGESEVADNTVVIYTTDHGENMGEHHLWWKNCMYDSAAHVPLIIRWPKRWKGGQRRKAVCSHVDLVQTILDIAGVNAPKDWDGDSLEPVLDDPGAPWKNSAISEYYAHNIASGFVMFRRGRYKYVYHTPADADHPAERQLFDMEADPDEFTDLAGRPEHRERIADMHAAMVKELGENPDDTEARCRADYAKGYGRKKPEKKEARKKA